MPMVQGGAGGGDEEGLERWGVAGSVDRGMREEGGGYEEPQVPRGGERRASRPSRSRWRMGGAAADVTVLMVSAGVDGLREERQAIGGPWKRSWVTAAEAPGMAGGGLAGR